MATTPIVTAVAQAPGLTQSTTGGGIAAGGGANAAPPVSKPVSAQSSTPTPPTPPAPSSPSVVTSAPAAGAIVDSQAKLQAALAKKTPVAPSDGSGNTTVTPPTPPTPPAPPTKNNNTGSSSISSGQYGYYKDPSSGAITYYDSNGNVLPTNPIGGDQYKLNPQDTPNANGGLIALTTPPGSQSNSDGSGTDSGTSIIPGTDIPSTGDPTTDKLIGTMQSQINESTQAAQDVSDSLTAAREKMDESNQELIDTIATSYNDQISSQQGANSALVAGMTQQGIRSGISMYAPGIYQSNIAGIVSDGIAKINAILDKKSAALAKAQQANDKEDYDALYQEMQNFDKAKSDEQTQTLNLLKSVQAQKKITDSEAKQAVTDAKTQQDQATKEATAHAWAVLEALDSAAGGIKGESTLAQDTDMVQRYAAIYGLDSQKLLSAVEQLKQTKDLYGSSPEGQYAFYSAQTTATGGKPMSFADWQAWSAANKSNASGSAKGTPTKDDVSGMSSELDGVKGSDGFISPTDWKKGLDAWTNAGHSAASFISNFKNYANPEDVYAGIAGNKKSPSNRNSGAGAGSALPPGVTAPGQ